MLMELIFDAKYFRENDVYVGLCRELNISSFGNDIEEAKLSLLEAVQAFTEACEEMGTLEEVLEEAGFIEENGVWVPREPVMEEKLAVSL
jgi:predicted RNase H-like HicB family nuclease